LSERLDNFEYVKTSIVNLMIMGLLVFIKVMYFNHVNMAIDIILHVALFICLICFAGFDFKTLERGKEVLKMNLKMALDKFRGLTTPGFREVIC